MSAAEPHTASAMSAASIERWKADDLQLLRSINPGHIPPVRDNKGFELAVHKSLANRAIDHLHSVAVPREWSRQVAYPTRSALRAERAREMRPHASFDVDGDGFVSAEDYSIARKHDLSGGGILEGGQRRSAVAETCQLAGSRLGDAEIGGNQAARRLMEVLAPTLPLPTLSLVCNLHRG